MITGMQLKLLGKDIIHLMKERAKFHEEQIVKLNEEFEKIGGGKYPLYRLAAITEALDYHKNQAKKLNFYAKYIIPDEIHLLSAQDISEYELLVLKD